MVFLNVPSFEVLLPAVLGSWLWTGQLQPGVRTANLAQHNHGPDQVKKFLHCRQAPKLQWAWLHPRWESFTQYLLCCWNNLG